ncbi:MAG: hypothetical protein KF688_07710 [Pirellulales bacterium]|nr:hypothetical protein [Pirellulales bacterium]
MRLRLRIARVAFLAACAVAPALAAARTWTDSTGAYTVEADLIAFDEKTAVLQRGDHHLVEVPLENLSPADRDYLTSKEAQDRSAEVTGAMQIWTTRHGKKVEGRIVDYVERDVTLHRRRGKLYVNDRTFDNLPEVYQRIVERIVEHFDETTIETRVDLNRWVARQKGKPRTFHCEGVVIELANGDEYAAPFFLFAERDLDLLQPGWQEWTKSQSDEESRASAAFRLQALAAAKHRDQETDRQIARLQLAAQAVNAGIVALWEVTLYPGRGIAGPPIWAVFPGRSSADAVQAALANNPGYVVGPVRRVSR